MLTSHSFKTSSLRLHPPQGSLQMGTRTFSISPPVDVLSRPCTLYSRFAHAKIHCNLSIISAGKCTTSGTIHTMNSSWISNSTRKWLPASQITYGRSSQRTNSQVSRTNAGIWLASHPTVIHIKLTHHRRLPVPLIMPHFQPRSP